MDRSDSFEKKLVTYAVLNMKGVGPATLKKAGASLNAFDEEDLLDRLKDVTKGRCAYSVASEAYKQAVFDAEIALNRAIADGQEILSCFDEGYPSGLRDLNDPPGIIYLKGNKELLSDKCKRIAVVGSRRASLSAKAAARMFGRCLSDYGMGVVSGLAVGCDTCAHEGCLESGGAALAVLPAGVDRICPKENVALAARILTSGGLLVSEYPPGTEPTKGSFVKRDRIQVALASGTIVVEAFPDGGTMHAVAYSKRIERPIGVYVTDGRRLAPGNAKLLRDGSCVPISDRSGIEYFVTSLDADVSRQGSLF